MQCSWSKKRVGLFAISNFAMQQEANGDTALAMTLATKWAEEDSAEAARQREAQVAEHGHPPLPCTFPHETPRPPALNEALDRQSSILRIAPGQVEPLEYRLCVPDLLSFPPARFKYHAFISHKQANAADQVKTMFLELQQRGLSVWYDME